MDGRITDWRAIGAELSDAGWGPTRVAEFLNLPRSTVRRWFSFGAEPGFHSGAALLRLHVRVVSCKPVRAAWQLQSGAIAPR